MDSEHRDVTDEAREGAKPFVCGQKLASEPRQLEKQDSELEAALKQAETTINDVSELVNELQERLDPVLVEEAERTEDTGLAMATRAYSSQRAREVASLAYTLEFSAERVRDIMGRLEV